MNTESPYTPPQSDLESPVRPGFVRHYEVEGDQLRVREGAMLPDVCLLSGEEGESLKRSTQRLFLRPALLGWLIVPFLLFVAYLRPPVFSPILLVVVIAYALVGRKSVILHYAYSRSSVVIRFAVSLGAMLAVLFMVKQLYRYFDFEQRWYYVFVIVAFALAVLIRQKTKGFRVSKIQNGWATLDHVHPKALLRLRELKQRS